MRSALLIFTVPLVALASADESSPNAYGRRLAGATNRRSLVGQVTGPPVKAISRLSRRDLFGDDTKVLQVFPTIAYPDQASGFVMDFHAVGHSPDSSFFRANGLRLFLEQIAKGGDGVIDEKEEDNFKARIAPFISDPIEEETVLVLSPDGSSIEMGELGEDGHLESTVPLPGVNAGDQLTITSTVPQADTTSTVIVGGNEGFGVISDVDDTIKVSQVLDKRQLVSKTFFEDATPVDTMSELYAYLKGNLALADSEPVIYYLSASPWQLFSPLMDFISAFFPAGELILNKFDLSFEDFSSVIELKDVRKHKVSNGLKVFAKFPSRKFVLIGDSGQLDPEIYAELHLQAPDSVACILIRRVSGADPAKEAEQNDPTRFAETFKAVPQDKWALFDKGADLLEVDFKNACKPASALPMLGPGLGRFLPAV